MKRTLSVILMAALVLSICAANVYAAQPEPEVQSGTVYSTDEFVPSQNYKMTESKERDGMDDQGHLFIGLSVVDGEVVYDETTDADGNILTTESNWTEEDFDSFEVNEDGSCAIMINSSVEGPGFTAIYAAGTEEGPQSDVTVSGSLTIGDETAGEYACDFTGLGSAFVAATGSTLTLKDFDFTSYGFMRDFAIAYGGNLNIINSSVLTLGSNPLTESYDGWINTRVMGLMIAPPWVLGLMGGIRSINMLGSSHIFIQNSDITTGGWALLSIDGAKEPKIDVLNCNLRALSAAEGGMDSGWRIFGYDETAYGSGYGCYSTGSSTFNFYGTQIDGVTYGAVIKKGVSAYYKYAGDIELISAEGESFTVPEGEERTSVINSVFGFYSQRDGDLKVMEGTEVNSEEATIIYKAGNMVAEVNDSVLNNNGILLDMIDDDDHVIHFDDDFNGFFYIYTDPAGLPSAWTDEMINEDLAGIKVMATVDELGRDESQTAQLILEDGEYSGDILNGTGSNYAVNERGTGYQPVDAADIIIDNAVYSGAMDLTEYIHGIRIDERGQDAVVQAILETSMEGMEYGYEPIKVAWLDEDFQVLGESVMDDSFDPASVPETAVIQFTQFSMYEYYLLGHVVHTHYDESGAVINVMLKNGGSWAVTDETHITKLVVDDTSAVYGEMQVNEDGTLTLLPSDDAVIEAGEYGVDIVLSVPAEEGAGESAGGESGGESAESEGGESEGEAAESEAVESEGEAPEVQE